MDIVLLFLLFVLLFIILYIFLFFYFINQRDFLLIHYDTVTDF